MKYPALSAFFLMFLPAGASAQTAPMTALQYEQVHMLKAIDTGDTAYIKAHFDFIRSFQGVNPGMFFDRTADLNFRDTDGNTPLIRAAMQPNAGMVQLLVDGGADLNAVNVRNESALVTSYIYHHYAITQFLLSRGAADPYQVSQLLKNSLAQEKASIVQEANTDATLELAGGAVVAAGIGVAVAAGSGGGSGGASAGSGATNADAALNPQNLTPSTFLTSEALGQQGIAGMNTQYALARGYDGSIYSRNSDGTLISSTPIGFVKVAVVDSGIDLTHPDLAANLLTGSSVTCNDSGCVAGGGPPAGGAGAFHGTAVAGIIAAVRNNAGIYGVASQAKVMSIGFADNSSNLTNGDAPGIKIALDNGAQVFNGSYGVPSTGPPSATLTDVQAQVNNIYAGTSLGAQFQRGVTAHAIFVFAAGNESVANPDIPAGLPYYFQGATAPSGITQGNYNTVNPSHFDWSKNWVAVVSVNNSNVISSFSNRCGVAANWCLAAPGEISMSTNIGGGYTGAIQGTSFAAPNVTGAVAVMLGAFPQLTPEKALQILFDTATDLGAAGVDAVYGHGLVNLEKATSPTDGGWSLTSLAHRSFAFAQSGMSLSAPFGNAVANSHEALQFLDGYGKNYSLPLSSVAGQLSQTRTSYDRLDQLAGMDDDNSMAMKDGAMLHFSTQTPQAHGSGNADGKISKLSYSSPLPLGGADREAEVTFNYKMNLADAVVPVSQRGVTGEALKNPYLQLAEGMNSSVAALRQGSSTLTVAGYYGSLGHDDYNYRFSTGKNISGMYSEVAWRPFPAATITVDSGMSVEKNSLLGSEASGAFGIDRAATYYTGIAGRYALSDHVVLIANYHSGLTQVSADSSSLINGFDTISTNAFAIGGEWAGIAGERDTLGLVMSQPLRVNKGSAGLVLPVGVGANGDMQYAQSNLNLAPTGREMDFETYYTLKHDDSSSLGLDAMLRLQPDNTLAGPETTILAKYTLHLKPNLLKNLHW